MARRGTYQAVQLVVHVVPGQLAAFGQRDGALVRAGQHVRRDAQVDVAEQVVPGSQGRLGRLAIVRRFLQGGKRLLVERDLERRSCWRLPFASCCGTSEPDMFTLSTSLTGGLSYLLRAGLPKLHGTERSEVEQGDQRMERHGLEGPLGATSSAFGEVNLHLWR